VDQGEEERREREVTLAVRASGVTGEAAQGRGRAADGDARLVLDVAALGAAAAIAWLARRVAGEAATPADAGVRQDVRAGAPDRLRTAATVVSALGYPAVYMPSALLTAAWLGRQHAEGGPAVIASAVAGWATHHLLKFLVERERPPSQEGESNEERSFPSGHATAATAVALTTAYTLTRQGLVPAERVLPVALGVPLAVGVSRILVDEHWMTDVLGGWLTGAVTAAACSQLVERSLRRGPSEAGRPGAAAASAVR
jgi:membrane-associated phospholipid phosphatase